MPRKLKSQDGNPYEIIRGMWEGAYVSHFVRLFKKKFGFSCISTQDLEDALIVEESVVLADVCARLLRYLTGKNDILIANFDSYLRQLLIEEKAEVPRFLDNGTTWQDLTPEEKLGTLKWLIDHVHQKKEEDICDYLDENYSADDLRGICAGQDAFNNIYWYLDDLRLYREITPKKQNKKEWECVCVTLSDWQSFLKQFRKTTNPQERELYTYLNFQLFPIIEGQLLDKNNTELKNREAENISLIKQEREELEDMLEKKSYLDCSNGAAKSLDINGTDSVCHEKHNGTIGTVKSVSENDISEFPVKTEDNKPVTNMNHCDGHLNISERISPINPASASAMDIKTSVVAITSANSCGNNCVSTCGNPQDSCGACNGSSSGGGNGAHCNSSSSTANTTTISANSAQDVNMQPLSDNPSDNSSVASNKENAPPVSGNSGTDVPPMSAMSNMVGSTSIPATTASVQPLPSNMVSKSSFSMETQYMQQQSQIFVFSTALANKAAESVLSGHFPSIIAYHCAQPGTKRFLEKHPLKVQQFNRQNPAAWLNTLAQMKQGGRQIKGAINQFPGTHAMNHQFPGPSAAPVVTPCTGPCTVHGSGPCSTPRGPGPWQNPITGSGMGPGMPSGMSPDMMCGPGGPQSWSPQQFGQGMTSSPMNPRFPNPMSQGMGVRGMGPSGSPMMGCISSIGPNVGGPSFQGPPQGPGLNPMLSQGPGGPSTLTGVKVPDENLTPQQRQHREEQLAMIRKMHQLLFPDQHQHQHDQAQAGGMMAAQANMGPVAGGMPPHGAQPRFGPGDMCIQPGMDVCFSPHQSCMGDHEHPHPPSDMFPPSGMMGPGFHQNFPPSSVAAQLEWQKLQQQFYEERRKKHQGCSGMPLAHPSSVTQTGPQPQPQPQQLQQQQLQQQPPLQQQSQQPQTPQQQPQQSLNSPSPSMGLSPGTRMQGPPPPYHQTPRRTMPSPHPASPNPVSLSLPSPRTVSGLPSPADPSRQFPHPTPPGPRLPHPSPGAGTPVGGNSLHTTPLNSPKPLNSSSGPGSNSGTLIRTPTTPSNTASTPTSTPTSSCVTNALPGSGPSTPAGPCSIANRKQNQQTGSDMQDTNSMGAVPNASGDFNSVSCPVSTPSSMSGDMFTHGLHPCSQPGQKHEHCVSHPAGLGCNKEPSLMPVPSPQQIQYLNAFDGQELTIQKQPNTSIRDIDLMSPASMPTSMVMSTGSHSQFQSPDGTPFPNTPGSCPSTLEGSQDSISARYPASAPASIEGSMQRFPVPSPQMPGFETGHRHMLPLQQSADTPIPRFPGVHSIEMLRIPGPGGMPNTGMDENMPRFPGQSPQGPGFGPAQPGGMENMPRYPGNVSEAMQRFRGPSPHGATAMDMMHARFMGSSPHMPGVDNIPHSNQFGAMGSESVAPIPSQSYPSPAQVMVSRSSPCVGGTFAVDSGMAHSHLQNLQKMTPPFEALAANKMSSEVMSPMGPCPAPASGSNSGGNMNIQPYGETSPLPSTQVGPTQRLTHFDPIASMAAMSESTGPLVTTTGNTQPHQSLMTTTMNMSSMQVANNPSGSSQPNIVNFHTNMQSMQGVLQSSGAGGMPNQHNQYNMASQMAHNVCCGPQTVNNTYVNATMSIQQLNIQNVTTSTYNAGVPVPTMNPHGPMMNQHPGCQGSGANTVSCSVTTNHPIMHSAVSPKTSTVSMGISSAAPRVGPQQFPGQPLGVQRNLAPVGAAVSPTMMARAPGAVTTPFNSTNIQVKASAPNTIQYLPARPQNAAAAPNRPPSLEFLQRFAAPLTNLDNKVPTHNLQYFPNTGASNTPAGPGNVTLTPTAPGAVGPGMMTGQRTVNMMMGPMMRGPSPAVVSQTGGQMFPGGSGLPGTDSPIFGRLPGPSGPPLNTQMVPLNAMGGGQNPSLFPNKQMPLALGGMAPDATQPLPPSMGQSFNYKQSPFYGPTTADPNYAVQFHNFQQQLYATNTRGSQMNSQNNLTSGQGFFGPK